MSFHKDIQGRQRSGLECTLDKISRRLKTRHFLFAVVVIFLGYTLSMYWYASMIIEYNGELWWRSTPQGSLFPIPYGPGMLTALSPVSKNDAFIYKYLLRIPSIIAIEIFTIILIWFIAIKRPQVSRMES